MLAGIKMAILLIGLFLCAWIDWRRGQVSIPILIIAAMTAVFIHLLLQEESVFYLVSGMMIGIVMLLYGWFTKESIGYGDGCLFMMTGLFLGFWDNLALLVLASGLAGVSAVLLLLMKKRKKQDRIPFVPFVFVAYVCMLGKG